MEPPFSSILTRSIQLFLHDKLPFSSILTRIIQHSLRDKLPFLFLAHVSVVIFHMENSYSSIRTWI